MGKQVVDCVRLGSIERGPRPLAELAMECLPLLDVTPDAPALRDQAAPIDLRSALTNQRRTAGALATLHTWAATSSRSFSSTSSGLLAMRSLAVMHSTWMRSPVLAFCPVITTTPVELVEPA